MPCRVLATAGLLWLIALCPLRGRSDAPVNMPTAVSVITDANNIVTYGDFEDVDENDPPLGLTWGDHKYFKLMEKAGNHFLRLNNLPDAEGKWESFLAAPCRFRLDPTWKKVRIQARMRARNLQVGQMGHEKARLAALFQDATGTGAGPYQPVLDLGQDSDWVNLKVDLTIPPGSIYVTLSPEMIGCRGVADYDNI